MKTFLLIIVCAVTVPFACAQEQPSPADMAKMWIEYEKLMTPGAGHAVLGKFVGDWNVASKWYSAKGAEPVESNATSTAKWFFGGRFVQSDFSGDMNGRPFKGLGIEGYDTFRKTYTMLWLDEMGTAMYTAEGTISDDGKTITYLGRHDDPMTGERDLEVKYVYNLVDEDRHVFYIIEKPGTPDEYTAMEMVYTRK